MEKYVHEELVDSIRVSPAPDPSKADIAIALTEDSSGDPSENCNVDLHVVSNEVVGASVVIKGASPNATGALDPGSMVCIDRGLESATDYKEEGLADFPTAHSGSPLPPLYWQALWQMRSEHNASVARLIELMKAKLN